MFLTKSRGSQITELWEIVQVLVQKGALACSSEPIRLAPQALTLQKAITCRMVELQSMWDDAHVPIKLQGHMLHQLFWMFRRRA